MSEGRRSRLDLYRRVALEVRPYWWHLAGILVLGLLATPVALLMPLPLKIAVDNVIGSEPVPWFLGPLIPEQASNSPGGMLFVAIALLLLITFINLLLTHGTWLWTEYTGEKMVLRFRGRLFQHAQRLSLAYHDEKGLSDATYRIQYDAPAVQWLVIHSLVPLVTAGFTLIGMIYVTTRISLNLALVALAVAPPIVVLTRIYSHRLREKWRQVKLLEWSALSVVQEVFGAIRVVKAFNQEDREFDRFVARSSQGLWQRVRVLVLEGAFGVLVGAIIAGGTAAVLYVGVSQVRAGSLTLGSLLLVMSYLAQLYGPLQAISKQITGQQGSLASAERAFAILDQAPAVTEREGARHIARAAGAIEFSDVSFAYPSGGPAVLRNVSFEVPAGTRVGIAGKSGSGKTTLLSLLTRFYDGFEGRILLDGADVRDYDLSDLREQFSIVLQEPILFSTSIAENIAYARPGASEAEIVGAAKAANAHDFIVALPDGYDTLVGERGMRLSGGERQRISLARAFLKDAPILILDEPTSSVDVGTEAAIMEAMDRLMRGRTTFMIAHRLSTIENCDARIVLENGNISFARSAIDEQQFEKTDRKGTDVAA